MILNPTRIHETIFIDADPERVWEFFTRADQMSALLPKRTEIRVLSEDMEAVGARWLVSNRAGDTWVDTLTEVTESARPLLLAVRSSTNRMTGTTRTSLIPQGGGTLLVVEGTADWEPGPATILQRILTAVIGPVMTRRTIQKVKRLIEQGS